jgi:hypothetical protein
MTKEELEADKILNDIYEVVYQQYKKNILHLETISSKQELWTNGFIQGYIYGKKENNLETKNL